MSSCAMGKKVKQLAIKPTIYPMQVLLSKSKKNCSTDKKNIHAAIIFT